MATSCFYANMSRETDAKWMRECEEIEWFVLASNGITHTNNPFYSPLLFVVIRIKIQVDTIITELLNRKIVQLYAATACVLLSIASYK